MCGPLGGTRGDTLLEPLTPKETNFINTCAEAMAIMHAVNHPALQLHQDVKAMLAGSRRRFRNLIDRFKHRTRHFPRQRHEPAGTGMVKPPTSRLPSLRDSHYDGWVSVEVFDYSPGAERIAVDSLEYMRKIERVVSAC